MNTSKDSVTLCNVFNPIERGRGEGPFEDPSTLLLSMNSFEYRSGYGHHRYIKALTYFKCQIHDGR